MINNKDSEDSLPYQIDDSSSLSLSDSETSRIDLLRNSFQLNNHDPSSFIEILSDISEEIAPKCPDLEKFSEIKNKEDSMY